MFQQIDGLVQDCSNSIANSLELQQFCTKPLSHWDNDVIENLSVQKTHKPIALTQLYTNNNS